MPRPLAGCSETLKRFSEVLQRFRVNSEALQRFTEALSNLTRPGNFTNQCTSVMGKSQIKSQIPKQQQDVSKHYFNFIGY